MKDLQELLADVREIAARAGREILEYHGREVPVEYKADDSPLTLADRASHQVIVDALGALTPEIPVLSEESSDEETAERRSWSRFWLVDPLDGTKEFIKQTGEFTVNIALVEGDRPMLGVVHIPVSGVTYEATRGLGARVLRPGEEPAAIRVRRADRDRLTVVASRDHAGPRVKAFLESLEGAEVTSMGSSLKFCLVAEGKADFYPRVVPTMEWDTGAAQCIVEEAGGVLTDLDGRALRYNKECLRNPSIMTYGDRDIDWARLFAGD